MSVAKPELPISMAAATSMLAKTPPSALAATLQWSAVGAGDAASSSANCAAPNYKLRGAKFMSPP